MKRRDIELQRQHLYSLAFLCRKYGLYRYVYPSRRGFRGFAPGGYLFSSGRMENPLDGKREYANLPPYTAIRRGP